MQKKQNIQNFKALEITLYEQPIIKGGDGTTEDCNDENNTSTGGISVKKGVFEDDDHMVDTFN